MAKRDKQFWQELTQKAGFDDKARDAVLQALENKIFEDGLYASLVPREESDKFLTDARTAQTKADEAIKQAQEQYQANLLWHGRYTQDKVKTDTELAKLARYRQAYPDDAIEGANGNANGNENGNSNTNSPANGNYITKEDLRQVMANQWTLNEQLMAAQADYRARFSKELPYADLKKIALEPANANRAFTDIYQTWLGPRVEEQQTAAHATELERVGKEKYDAGFAKGQLREPTDNVSPEHTSPLYQGQAKPEEAPDDVKLQQNFVEEFNAAGKTA